MRVPERALPRLGAVVVMVAALAGAAAGPAPAPPIAPDEAALARLRHPPPGLPPVPVPADNAPTPERIALGRKLFFDRRLSVNGTMSCGMCHIPEQGFTNNELATPVGVGGRSLKRNAPTVLNSGYASPVFHDGRAASLEAQVRSPLVAPNEMANPTLAHVVARIRALPDYAGLFERAYGSPANANDLARAIACWERTLVAGDSPFDRWRYGGEDQALTAEQKRGFALFTGRAGCASCHVVGQDHALFTDHDFHDTGLESEAVSGQRRERPVPVEIEPGVVVPLARAQVRSVGGEPERDLGRLEATGRAADSLRFRTPDLRNVTITAPYMHDGSLRTLDEVVRFYDRGARPRPGVDPRIHPLGLSEGERHALVRFLESLTTPDLAKLQADARSAPVGN